MDAVRFDNWSRGANNLAPRDRLPEGFFRHAVNLDPVPSGSLSLRTGYTKVYSGADVRACFANGDSIVLIDGTSIVRYDTKTGQSSIIGTVSIGDVAAVELNGQLYLRTIYDSIRIGAEVKPWAIPPPDFNVELVSGAMSQGQYKIAVVAVGNDGEESGASPISVTLPAGFSLRVTSSSLSRLRLYASAPDGLEMYSQGEMLSPFLMTAPDVSGARMTTAHMVPMPPCVFMAKYHAVLVGYAGNAVYVTEPMRPHLVDLSRRFFQYPDDVLMIATTDGGVYVSTSKTTWFVTALETDTPSQRVVAEFGAVSNSSTILPDGRAAWFTNYGQAIGDALGVVTLLNQQAYAPDVARLGGAGYIEHNGMQLVVTTMRGDTSANRLAAGDYCDVEITDER